MTTTMAQGQQISSNMCVDGEAGYRAPRITLNDKQLIRVAQAIGGNFELLAPELDITETELDRAKLDNPNTHILKVLDMLKIWRRKKEEEATMDRLCEAIYRKKEVVTIDNCILQDVISEMSGEVSIK